MKAVAFRTWIEKLKRKFLRRRDSYRPERYYMRGPGPQTLKKKTKSHDPASD